MYELLSIHQAAEILGVSCLHVFKAVSVGDLQTDGDKLTKESVIDYQKTLEIIL